jgi:hypothetical protein
MKTIHSPGVIPFGFLVAPPLVGTADQPPGGDLWRGIPGAVGFPNRYTFVDETTPDDSNYISQGLGGAGSIYGIIFGPPPAGATAITYRVRVRRMGGTNPNLLTAHFDLLRGGSLVHNENVPFVNLDLAFQTLEIVLTPTEVAALYGFAGNVTEFWHAGGGPGTDALEVSWAEVAFYA